MQKHIDYDDEAPENDDALCVCTLHAAVTKCILFVERREQGRWNGAYLALKLYIPIGVCVCVCE